MSPVLQSSHEIFLGPSPPLPPLTLEDVVEVARHDRDVSLGQAAYEAMAHSLQVVDHIVHSGEQAPPVYGVNTGFGALAEVRISASALNQLQHNLVRSHAAGVGTPLGRDAVRAVMLLRAAVLSRGYSGARPAICELLCQMLKNGIHPVIPSRGSVGASGDLAPLAHLALALIGEGRVEYRGQDLAAQEAMSRAGLHPIALQAKEGLALLNGTQHMSALGALAIYDAEVTCNVADLVGAMSLDGLYGNVSAFDPRVLAARPHPGQQLVGERLRALLADSAIASSHRDSGRVQDAYSLRCMPQVHGATRDVLGFARQVLEREINSVTDNPLVVTDDVATHGGVILSGGNFHGQPVALILDAASMAVAELASISERRIEQMVNPQLSNGLPPFLAPQSGLHSGFMIAQVTAASLVNENKVLTHPASTDSIPSSAGREDHVSMGAFAALKLRQIHDHVRTVLAIELLCAAQSIDLRRPTQSSPALEAAWTCLRQYVPPMDEDRPVYEDIALARGLIDSGELLEAIL